MICAIVWIVVSLLSYLFIRYALERDSLIAAIACAFWPISFIVGIVLVVWSLATVGLVDD